jgi:hypothetical protein
VAEIFIIVNGLSIRIISNSYSEKRASVHLVQTPKNKKTKTKKKPKIKGRNENLGVPLYTQVKHVV